MNRSVWAVVSAVVACVGGMGGVGGASALADPVKLPVNEAASSVDVELCILGSNCDDDSSPISGAASVEVDDPVNPTTITFTNFAFSVTDLINLQIIVPFGGLTATGNGLTVEYDQPGVPISAPIVGGMFTLAGAPVLAGGSVDYNATGVVCFGLSAEGLPCSDSVNLGTQGAITTDSFTGTVTVVDGVLTLESTVALTIVLDPKNPELATISVVAMITGSALLPVDPLPCEGDVDLDEDVDSVDLNLLLGSFGKQVPPNTSGDLDGDGDVDSVDLNELLATFGTAC